jgi:hypothetical protein
MARRPIRRGPAAVHVPVDPPWVDAPRPSRARPAPIEPSWAQDLPEPPLVPFEPDWASAPDAPDPVEPIDPPWMDDVPDDEDALRAALAEPAPIDPPWATAQTNRAPTGPVDPPWAENVRADDPPLEPIEPDWARDEEPMTLKDEAVSDPPWLNDPPLARLPARLRGPIDPPWVPDDVSDALDAAERNALEPFEPNWARASSADEGRAEARIDPDWVDDPPRASRKKPQPIDPGWESSARRVVPPPVEPDWANPAPRETEDEELFDPGWEATRSPVESIPDPIEPAWAIETEDEVAQKQTDPFETPMDDVSEPAPIRDGRVRRGAKRLRELASRDLNPFGRAKRQAARREAEREDLIRNAMRIRAETRAALGEENVDRLYEALMGSPPPKSEDD